jgi:hypothetical protein
VGRQRVQLGQSGGSTQSFDPAAIGIKSSLQNRKRSDNPETGRLNDCFAEKLNCGVWPVAPIRAPTLKADHPHL